jgi:deazaflavin-dependent oxidoreductase (nitroreductase family)
MWGTLLILGGAAACCVVLAGVLAMIHLHRKPREPFPGQTPDQHGESPLASLVRHVVRGLLRMGVPVKILGNPVVLLTMPGRRTGQPRTALVDMYQLDDGRRYVISTHGATGAAWVLNLRAAGRGTLQRGRRFTDITAVELPPEAAGPVLKELLAARIASPVGGFALRRTLEIKAGAGLSDFIHAAGSHPVFELSAPRGPSLPK